MGKKVKWFRTVKRALICNCCQGEQRENLGKSKHSDPLPTKEVETAAHDAAQPLPLAPIEGVKLTETGDEESKHAYSAALASAVAPEAVAVAAEAATEVVRLPTSMTRLLGESREEIAAIKIQAAFRGCLITEEWDDSLRSKEQIEANILNKQEAAIKRERALAYAFSHQWNSSSRSSTTVPTDPSNPQWGWNWLQRWMAARPWENHRTTEPKDDATIKMANCSTVGQTMKRHDTSMERTPSASQKSSRPPSRQSPATPQSKPSSVMNRKKSVSPGFSRCSADDDSRSMLSLQSEQPRRHSSSARDNESLVSSVSLPSYMASTESVRARSRFLSPQSERHGTLKERLTCSVKKKLSFPMADVNSISPPARIPKVEISPVKDVAIEKEQEANN
ncbi:IQ calmodulin-binding motif [Musa troglodytarum]|uniref:IQ calmodulin-binding motif n=1 Tax=Musa troglodytarum TaxID=320322 RepID=A0A9E7L6N0_9LILI|nr:IQ calmodulin-binding motif [Musa troglodytarum]